MAVVNERRRRPYSSHVRKNKAALLCARQQSLELFLLLRSILSF